MEALYMNSSNGMPMNGGPTNINVIVATYAQTSYYTCTHTGFHHFLHTKLFIGVNSDKFLADSLPLPKDGAS